MINIKKIINKILYPNTWSNEAYVKYLRKNGATIGDNTTFIRPKNTIVDTQRLNYIKIGNECCITSGVVILAHDWSYSVIAKKYGEAPGKQRDTIIGNNVFVGMNSIILMGTEIGNNVIIGAGSVVSGYIESDSVYAGNPAKKICSLDEHYEKLKMQFEQSACNVANKFISIHGKMPEIENMELYASLFIEKSDENMEKYFSKSHIKEAIKNMPKKYDSINELLNKNINSN